MNNTLTDWRPEDETFWKQTGRRIAQRNLWISIPALLVAFCVWMLWSVIVVKLKSVGFKFSEAQEFWLTALLALTGATLRIFYAFAVPVFGGRNWTVITTASLLLPCLGIGIAVQNQGPEAEAAARRDAAKEASATLGFTSAIGAYGGFIIPITFGAAIKSGSPQTALLAFLVFYLTCVAITWWYYHRKGAETPC